MSEWVSVKDRLPEYKGEYLVAFTTTSRGKPRGVEISMSWFGYRKDFFHSSVTHWMPLPDPPKETA